MSFHSIYEFAYHCTTSFYGGHFNIVGGGKLSWSSLRPEQKDKIILLLPTINEEIWNHFSDKEQLRYINSILSTTTEPDAKMSPEISKAIDQQQLELRQQRLIERTQNPIEPVIKSKKIISRPSRLFIENKEDVNNEKYKQLFQIKENELLALLDRRLTTAKQKNESHIIEYLEHNNIHQQIIDYQDKLIKTRALFYRTQLQQIEKILGIDIDMFWYRNQSENLNYDSDSDSD